MTKILFLIHDLSHGGAEKVLVNLVNNMDSQKFDITVMALFGGGVNEAFLKPHIRYQTVFPRPFRGNIHLMKLLSPKQLHRLFIKEKYDIEVSYLEGPSARIVSGCPHSDTKLVSWIHISQHTIKKASKSFRSYGESLNCYEKFDRTICVSEGVKDDFAKLYPEVSNVTVLYNTNETDEILAKKEEAVEAEFLKQDCIRLCGVGKVVQNKGFDKLARIHKRLTDDGFKIHTYIFGVGQEKDSIQRYLRENKVDNTFTFMGYQTNPYKYVAKCHLFVCASAAEGFSTAATEALILGTPVITTPVAGMAEMLGDNEYGVITQMSEESLYNGIKELLGNPQLLEHYKKQAEKRGKFFSKENTVKAVEDMLTELAIRK